jgi:hypothetical protein
MYNNILHINTDDVVVVVEVDAAVDDVSFVVDAAAGVDDVSFVVDGVNGLVVVVVVEVLA